MEELSRTSRDNNARLGITGMLLCRDGRFMQAIEGYTDERECGDRSMGFAHLSSDGPGTGPEDGASDFLIRTESPKEFLEGGRAWRYLRLSRLVRT